jgi:elongation factor Ts
MEITAQMVKELRERSGSGVMQCKEALREAAGDLEKAFEILRKKGAASAEKKAGRATKEGMVGSYIHAGSKLGVLIEVNCETDFVAKNDEFKALVRDLAMQVAATSPGWVRREEVPDEVVKKEREILAAQPDLQGKPPAVAEKILEGRIGKFYSQVCLLEQEYVKEHGKLVSDRVRDAISKLGENITVRRFARFEVGGGAS